MRASRFVLAVISLLIVVARASIALAQVEPWLALQSTCSAQGAEERLVARLSAEMVGPRAADLQARVAIEHGDGRYHVTVRVGRGASTVGVKQLVAFSCREAEDAALAVLALALSDPSADERAPTQEKVVTETVAKEVRVPEPAVSVPPASLTSAPATPPVMRASLAGEQRRDGLTNQRSAADWSVSLRAGVDAGTLPVMTAYLGAGVSRFFGPFAIRALLGVGLPYREVQQNEAGSSEQLQGDFAMFDLGLCYGFGARLRFATCAASDVSVIRSERTLRAPSEPDRVASRIEPLLSGVLTAMLGYQLGAFTPELELSAVAVAFGELQGASRLALRGGASVGMQF
jgi:hypothetical protein